MGDATRLARRCVFFVWFFVLCLFMWFLAWSKGHNGGVKERLLTPAAGKKPHIIMVLFDDYVRIFVITINNNNISRTTGMGRCWLASQLHSRRSARTCNWFADFFLLQDHITFFDTDDIQTPNLNQLVREGIELDRNYVYKYCSPTRSALQVRQIASIRPITSHPLLEWPQSVPREPSERRTRNFKPGRPD